MWQVTRDIINFETKQSQGQDGLSTHRVLDKSSEPREADFLSLGGWLLLFLIILDTSIGLTHWVKS